MKIYLNTVQRGRCSGPLSSLVSPAKKITRNLNRAASAYTGLFSVTDSKERQQSPGGGDTRELLIVIKAKLVNVKKVWTYELEED